MHILFATDGSSHAGVALDMLCDLPFTSLDRVTVVAVPVHRSFALSADPGAGAFVAELVQAESDMARATANAAAARLRALDVPVAVEIREGPAAPTIVALGADIPADLVVLGSRGIGGIAGAVLGSTARAVARHSTVPVLVVRDRREAPRRILVAVDGSPDSVAAVRLLGRLPLRAASEITLLHVIAPVPDAKIPAQAQGYIERAEQRMSAEVLASAAKALGPRSAKAAVMERGRVEERILEKANATGADLIVLGSRGQTLGRGFLQGSVADRVLTEAHCAVLVAKAPSHVTGADREAGRSVAKA